MGIINASYGAEIPPIPPCGPGGSFEGKVGFGYSFLDGDSGVDTSMQTIVWGSASSTGSLTFGITPLPSIDTPYWETATIAKSVISEAARSVWYETATISGSETVTFFTSSLETSGSFAGYVTSFHTTESATGSVASETNITGRLKIVPADFTGYASDLETISTAKLGTMTVESTFVSYAFGATQTVEAGDDLTLSFWGIDQSSSVVTGTTAGLENNGGAQVDGPYIFPRAIWVYDTAFGASDHSVVRLGASYGTAIDNAIPHVSLIHPRIGDVVSFSDFTYGAATEYRFTDDSNMEFLTIDSNSQFTSQSAQINLVSTKNSSHGRTYASLGYFQIGEPIFPLGLNFAGTITAVLGDDDGPNQNIAETSALDWHLRASSYASSSTKSSTIAVSKSSVLSAPDGGWVYLQPDYFITAHRSGLLF
jgi:hypothetical protein